MNNMKNNLLYTILAIAVLSFAACKKSFLDETPISVESAQSVFTTKAGFEAGLYGITI